MQNGRILFADPSDPESPPLTRQQVATLVTSCVISAYFAQTLDDSQIPSQEDYVIAALDGQDDPVSTLIKLADASVISGEDCRETLIQIGAVDDD